MYLAAQFTSAGVSTANFTTLSVRPISASMLEALGSATPATSGEGFAISPAPVTLPANGPAVSGLTALPALLEGKVVTLDAAGLTHAAEGAEVFTVAAGSGDLGVILGYGQLDRLDLTQLGNFKILDLVAVDDVMSTRKALEGGPLDAPAVAGTRFSLDLDGDGKEDAHLTLSGDLKPFTAPEGAVTILPGGGPASDWQVNMPILSGRPPEGGIVTLPGGEAGSAPGSTGDFTILPFPMPTDGVVVQPGEAHILPFPFPGAPVSFIPWGSWIGL